METKRTGKVKWAQKLKQLPMYRYKTIHVNYYVPTILFGYLIHDIPNSLHNHFLAKKAN